MAALTDHAAERAFVACALFNADAAQLVAETPTGAFDDGQAILVARAVRDLVKTDRSVDSVTVAGVLEDRGQLAAAGGQSALAMMEAKLPDPSRAAVYRQRVIDLYLRRIAGPLLEYGDWPALREIAERGIEVNATSDGRWSTVEAA